MSSGLSAKFLITGFAIDISDSLSTMHTFYDTGGTAARHVGLSPFKFGILCSIWVVPYTKKGIKTIQIFLSIKKFCMTTPFEQILIEYFYI